MNERNNKGITLIALVVTIIILLILAGVSITTLSGDGLFGRAQSSAAKYEQASQAENSTISSLMDKYDNYEQSKTKQITISWSSALAELGNFINSETPDSPRTTDLYDKEIMFIKPDGTKIVKNPYQAGSVTVPEGTKFRMYYYCDTATGKTEGTIFNSGANVESENSNQDGSLCYIEIVLDKNGRILSDCDDNDYEWADSGKMYVWSVYYLREGESLPR